MPEDIELEIVSAYCGLRCPLPEALDRRREYASCLAELDFVRSGRGDLWAPLLAEPVPPDECLI